MGVKDQLKKVASVVAPRKDSGGVYVWKIGTRKLKLTSVIDGATLASSFAIYLVDGSSSAIAEVAFAGGGTDLAVRFKQWLNGDARTAIAQELQIDEQQVYEEFDDDFDVVAAQLGAIDIV